MFLLVITTSCEEETKIYDNTTFVQLADDRTVSIVENSGLTLEVAAILGSPQGSDITVNFDVTGSAAASRYTLSATSVTIPAGATSGSVTFTPIDNDDIDGDVDVTLTLSSTSGLPIGIGGEAFNSVEKTITIVDDNVPCNDYVLSITTDTYGDETFWDLLDSNGDTVAGSDGVLNTGDGDVTNVNITLADGCYTLRVFDFWGDNGPTYTLSCGALVAVDDSDGLGGIPGLDVTTVPSPGFRDASGPADPYSGFADSHEFCVNQ